MPQRHAIDLPVAKLLHQPQIASQSDKGNAAKVATEHCHSERVGPLILVTA
jgi:hypothetical protein